MPSLTPQTGSTFVVFTAPSRQHPDNSVAAPATMVPAPSNMTINVNINKSKSQASSEIVQEVNAHAKRLKAIEGCANANHAPNSSSDSLMTNDSSDSGENRPNASGYLNTPLATRKNGTYDGLNTSARRQLFSTTLNTQRDGQHNTIVADQPTSRTIDQMPSQSQSQIGETFDLPMSPSRRSMRRPIEPAAATPRHSRNIVEVRANDSAGQPWQEIAQKLNPVVVLSPLHMENMLQTTRKHSAMPLDLVLTPPTNFQNERETSPIATEHLIVEASPTTCEMRKLLLEQRNFDEVC